MEEQSVLKALTALSQAHRLRVFRALVVAGQAGLTPGQIAEAQQIPAATLSFHLKELVQAGLLTQERQGRSLIYRADFAQMNALLAFLTENCCQGDACAATPSAPCC
ncbi:MAG TPA: metalloregulator ArsR/SmtB family transcription factor [Alicycliphilus sp.]|jgi:DNA-binding transcriptional ArsR family regulator|nr:helix-turn-helix transcriptional regulator [Ottowia sp.]MBP7324596.1 helix-turn-helix transcriptional regulator [Alicycliphilus sp.]MCA0440402.1 metalloregulator ArsR/SmtB family transcription factor [Pseudomonadota bacterium]MBP7330298.1 helix-turn-helix transcriptional regulator [Alicycliphilus sp.]MBP8137847.1 helix-turn-helix transcriptional regulator [Alicycliphilus sp.]